MDEDNEDNNSETTTTNNNNISDESKKENSSDSTKKEFKRQMLSSLCNIPLDSIDENAEPKKLLSFGGVEEKRKTSNTVLRMRNEGPHSQDILRALDHFQNDSKSKASRRRDNAIKRNIPGQALRKLSLPGVVNDFYLDLLCWSKGNILAIALDTRVYLYNPVTKVTEELTKLSDVDFRGVRNYVTSVSWCTRPGLSEYLAIGTHSGDIQLWDCHMKKLLRCINGHRRRVGSIAWNDHWLTSGGKDSLILQHDLRSAFPLVSVYKAHEQEVVGLKWNGDGKTLASGGNDDYLCIWDAAMSSSRQTSGRVVSPRVASREHTAAVKALDWCPFQRGLLASGGGRADRTIKLWDSNSGAVLNSINTGSQVSGVMWSPHQLELCSSHGSSENNLVLWKYGSGPKGLTKVKEFCGHKSRVLSMACSPDGSTIVSASADETLLFWNIFGPPARMCRGSSLSRMGDLTFGMSPVR